MFDFPVEDYCETVKDSVEGIKAENQDGALDSTYHGGACSMNVDLDQKKSFETQNITHDDDDSHCNYFEEDLSKKGKFRTARDNLKKINFIVKSKIDLLGQVPMFGGKKRTEKQNKGRKSLSFSKDKKQEEKAKLNLSPSHSNEKLTNEGAATLYNSQTVPVAEGSAKGDVISHDISVAEGSAIDDGADRTLITFSDDVDCDMTGINRPVSTDSHQIWLEMSSPNKTSDSLCEFSQQPGDLMNIQTEITLVEPLVCGGSADIPQLEATSSPWSHSDLKHQNLSKGNWDCNSLLDIAFQSGASQSKLADTIKSTKSINRGCLEGVGPAVPIDFINPVSDLGKGVGNNSEYNRFYFHSIEKSKECKKELPVKEECEELVITQSEIPEDDLESNFDDPYFTSDEESLSENEEDFWGSEFDDSPYQDDILSEFGGFDIEAVPDKPLPPKPEKKAFFSRQKSISNDPVCSDERNSTCLPLTINSQKHPPPVLPPQPSGLTQNQIKRRMVIESIVGSERSYLESLERLVREYEKTVLEFISQPKSHVRLVFLKMREIIFHHKMFQIELAECVKVWDKEEKIGDIFTASFSKTMLINAYSIYVNSFAATMDEIRSLQRSRQSFRDFLLKQEKLSCDRLSIFGLMVKPVQRFPQFIMFLQDLIKFTPQNHDDRMALQLALTELENVAYRLNERKRQSEQKFQARQIVQQLIKQKVQHVLNTWNLDIDPKRRLIRNDSLQQMHGEFENMRCKDRQVILMNDHVLCVKVIHKEQSGYTVEKYALRWMAKLKDLELNDTAATFEMKSMIKQETGQISISQRPDDAQDDPFHLLADLQEMIHDHSIIKQMTGLSSLLKRSYAGHGLRQELINEIMNDLQQMIQIKEEQLRLVNSCSIILQDSSRSDKPHYVLQTQTAALKQDWCVDFLIAKLALDKSNSLAWDGTSDSDGSDFDVIPAYFMKHIPVDIPKKYTNIKCAVSIYQNPQKYAIGLGLQHLWVCSSTPECGQVSILSIRNSKPALIESFRACRSDIMAVELVPSSGGMTKPGDLLFAEDTVWIAASQNEIFIFPLSSEDGVHRQPLASVKTSLLTISMKFVNEQLFCGSTDGVVTIYSREQDGAWNVSQPVTLSFGNTCVKLHFVHEDNIWLSCANRLYQFDIDSLQTRAINVLNTNQESHIDQVVKSGVGIWVSFHSNSVIKLFHLETMESLQEISVGNFVNRIHAEKSWTIGNTLENLAVTCLAVSRGLLWIGTSAGFVLTVPLPRLSDGVPLYRGSPKISLHTHKSPVRFIILLQCSSSVMDRNKPSSLSLTTKAKQNETLDLKEVQERKTRSTVEDISNDVVAGDDDQLLESEDKIQELLSSSTSVTATVAEQENGEVMSSKSESNIINIPCIDRQNATDKKESRMVLDGSCVELRHRHRSSEVDRRSQTLSFSSDLAHHNIIKSRIYSQSNLDLTSGEPHEVEVLYKALLEDDPDTTECRNVNDSDNTELPDRKGKKGGSRRAASTPFSNFTSHFTIAPWLKMSPAAHVDQSCDVEHQSETLKTVDQPLDVPCVHPSLPHTFLPSSVINLQGKSVGIFLHNDQPARPDISDEDKRIAGLARTHKSNSGAVVVVSGGDGYSDLDTLRREVNPAVNGSLTKSGENFIADSESYIIHAVISTFSNERAEHM